jgi:GntR family transcriptional regulator, histidine utilization repressor
MPTSEKIGFRDVKEIALGRIRDKTWAANTVIPRDVELAAEFGCARATVNRAMRELADEGFLDRKRKAGTRVNAAPVRNAKLAIPLVRAEIEATGASYRYFLVSREIVNAPEWLRARLGLKNSPRILHLQCVHYAGNRPFQFEDRWINIDTVPNVEHADFDKSGPNEWLVSQVPFSTAEISFGAAIADTRIAEFLSIADGEPIFTAERTTWLEKAPITFARMSFAHGYRLTTQY